MRDKKVMGPDKMLKKFHLGYEGPATRQMQA